MSGPHTPYPGYDVLSKEHSASWDDVTRAVVRARLEHVPQRRFFTEDEWRLLQAVCELLIPQPDRVENAVPIAPWIDQTLHEGRGNGFRYAGMPPLREAWRLGLEGIEREAQRRHGTAFAEVAAPAQREILGAVQRGEVSGGPWDRLPPKRFFTDLLLASVVGTYYAHPAAWSECGFGGPASPRGYVRVELGRRDAWEAAAHDEH
jgi:hypothetical protein